MAPLITTEANPNGFITAVDVQSVCKSLNIVDQAGNGQVTMLERHADKHEQFKGALNGMIAMAAAMRGVAAPVLQ